MKLISQLFRLVFRALSWLRCVGFVREFYFASKTTVHTNPVPSTHGWHLPLKPNIKPSKTCTNASQSYVVFEKCSLCFSDSLTDSSMNLIAASHCCLLWTDRSSNVLFWITRYTKQKVHMHLKFSTYVPRIYWAPYKACFGFRVPLMFLHALVANGAFELRKNILFVLLRLSWCLWTQQKLRELLLKYWKHKNRVVIQQKLLQLSD